MYDYFFQDQEQPSFSILSASIINPDLRAHPRLTQKQKMIEFYEEEK